MLFHLIYVSTAVKPMIGDELVSLLEQSRARNKRHRITGMLLYSDGHFMQVLEGEEASVMKIFEDISHDAGCTRPARRPPSCADDRA